VVVVSVEPDVPPCVTPELPALVLPSLVLVLPSLVLVLPSLVLVLPLPLLPLPLLPLLLDPLVLVLVLVLVDVSDTACPNQSPVPVTAATTKPPTPTSALTIRADRRPLLLGSMTHSDRVDGASTIGALPMIGQ
jgi:hypothetical protein